MGHLDRTSCIIRELSQEKEGCMRTAVREFDMPGTGPVCCLFEKFVHKYYFSVDIFFKLHSLLNALKHNRMQYRFRVLNTGSLIEG
jgi:hypothetical protein